MYGPGGGPGFPPSPWQQPAYLGQQTQPQQSQPFIPDQTSPLDPSDPRAQRPAGFDSGAVGMLPFYEPQMGAAPFPHPGTPPFGVTIDQIMQHMMTDPRTGKLAYVGGPPGTELMKYILGLTKYLNY